MKKFICVLLSAVMAFGVLSVAAVAAESIIPVHYVSVDADAQGYILIPLNDDGEYNSTYTDEDDHIQNGTFYVPDGGVIRFVVEYEDGYSDNFMTTVRYMNTVRYEGFYTGNPSLAEDEAILLTPDANGVYTIAGIDEAITITVYNTQSESMSSIFDFVKELIAFLVDLLMKFFGIDSGLGDEY
ncbi:MAG: hypothetical protein IJA31_13085 [Clostridia bacterium]|nr:hypothetical protein [Clostridia bacterium]